MNKNEILNIFTKTNAFLKGHFELSSGLHSDEYVQCALVLQYPTYTEKLGRAIADLFRNTQVNCVVGPALGGVTLAYEVARQLGVRGIFAERKEGTMQLRRGFSLKSDDRILVVEDVITTGGSVKEVITVLEQSNNIIVGVGSIVDRSASGVDFGYPFQALIKLPLRTFKPQECPLCKKGEPVMKPGSKKK